MEGRRHARLLYDEAVAYAKRLRAADMPCELTVVDGALHGFNIQYPDTPAPRRRSTALAAIAASSANTL